MIKNSKKHTIKAKVSFLLGHLLVFAIAMLVFAAESHAQYNYEMSLNPRRLGNQLGVEIWIKAISPSAAPVGHMNIGVSYNGSLLKAEINTAPNQPSSKTDAVQFDVDVTPTPLPYYVIESDFHRKNGFATISATSADGNDNTGEYKYVAILDAYQENGSAGFVPSSSGKGSFVGMLRFNILNADLLEDTYLSDFQFNVTSINTTNIESGDGLTNLNSLVDFKVCQDFAIRGITILNPGLEGQTINRYPETPYLSMGTNHGYPIYFERSGLAKPTRADGVYGTKRYAYSLSYSLDTSVTAVFSEFGRVAENKMKASQMTTDAIVNATVEGMIDYLNSDTNYYMTTGSIKPLPDDVAGIADLKDAPDGPGLDSVGYGGMLRVIWKGDPNFAYRSEHAKLKITQVELTDADDVVALTDREAYDPTAGNETRRGFSNASFVLGRLFFVQLDGTCKYLKSSRVFSTPSVFTVAAWVNLNGSKGEGSETGIVATSSGSLSAEEGGWMLYLKDGVYPAFRARLNGGSETDYVGIVQSGNALSVYNTLDASGNPSLSGNHSANWTHIAAVVNSNTVTLYVDGEEIDQYINNTGMAVRPMEAKMPIWVGVNPNTQDGVSGLSEEANYLYGGVKEVEIWRTALTQAQLRQYIAGVPAPSLNVGSFEGDVRTALELYYTLQGTKTDVAKDSVQDRANSLAYYIGCDDKNSAQDGVFYRPDGSHIKLTSPSCGEGVSNLKGKTYEIRWVAFGVGSSLPTPAGDAGDIMIQVSRDSGQNWFDAIAPFRYDEAVADDIALPLDNEEVEVGSAVWEPYNNVTITNIANDLQGVVDVENNYSKNVKLRISGSESRGQQDIYAESDYFVVAPHFALTNRATTKMTIPAGTKLNITSQNSFFEAWINPKNFPIDGEEAPYYPIIAKKDPTATTDEEGLLYALRLRPDGKLSFSLASLENGVRVIHTVISDSTSHVLNPYTIETNLGWTHVGVYLSIPENGSQAKATFYIDGVAQNPVNFDAGIVLDKQNTFPTYIGYENIGDNGFRFFDGDIREIRFWRNNPGGFSRVKNSDYPNTYQLDNFIQGALTVRANELGQFGTTNYAQGLVAAYSMDGGSWVNNGMDNSIPAYPADPDLMAHVYGSCSDRAYSATMPYIKVVEPVALQSVENTETALRVRWVGFDYNRNELPSFTVGENGIRPADMNMSTLGGGGTEDYPYTPAAGLYENASYVNSMTLPVAVEPFEFQGTADRSQFAGLLNLTLANPKADDGGQGNIPATSVNGRIKMFARANINSPIPFEYDNGSQGNIDPLMSEGPRFSITPPSNFTIRLLLEGYHGGSQVGIINNIGTTFESNGVRMRFYKDNGGGVPSDLVANSTIVSKKGYTKDAMNIANRGDGTNTFANIPFVLTAVSDQEKYFVVLDHQNYLPIMSAVPATFNYGGDKPNTWDVTSGWDFQAWSGVSGSVITGADVTETGVNFGSKYSAYGSSSAERTDSRWFATGLNYNNGSSSLKIDNALPSLVGGDVVRDGQINAVDRSAIYRQAISSSAIYDVTGDGIVNAADRTLVDHNANKQSSLFANGLTAIDSTIYPDRTMEPVESNFVSDFAYITNADPMTVISKEDPEYSLEYIANAKTNLTASNLKMKNNSLLGNDMEYDVSATVTMNEQNQTVNVDVYIQNTGNSWNMANATFALNYDPSVVNFKNFDNTGVVFNRTDLGYSGGGVYTAPTAGIAATEDPLENTRSIEIDFYGNTAAAKGLTVPNTKTHLGTLTFNMLRGDESIVFDWAKIRRSQAEYTPVSVVYDVDGNDLTAYADFEDIKPIIINKNIEIKTPNGGETLAGASTNAVSWLFPNNSTQIFIEYSANNGNTWNRINNTPVAVTSGLYNWNTPAINSTLCLVRIINANTSVELDRSDVTFAIGIAPTEITRPMLSDPVYIAGSKDYIRWYSTEKKSVYFEYSENGTNGWTKVTEVVSSDAGSVAWTVKTANTKTAYIRMVDAQDQNESTKVLAISDPFKILVGNLAISNPKKGDIFKSEQKTQIKWSSSGINTFTLQLSKDGGSTWENMATDVKASSRAWNWSVPNLSTITDKAIVRAIYNGDPLLEYSRTATFTIDQVNSVNELAVAGYAISSITPNPITDDGKINIDIPNASKVTISIYNTAGQRVAVLANAQSFEAGKHGIEFSMTGFSAGIYVVRMQVGSGFITKELVKVK